MTYYSFVDEETGDKHGSFETLHMDAEDYMWTNPGTCWFEILCNHIDMEMKEKEVEKICKLVNTAEFDGEKETAYLDEDQEEIYEALKKAPAELAGWYWWACLPGCLPDSDPFGPFETEKEAVKDAGGEWNDNE